MCEIELLHIYVMSTIKNTPPKEAKTARFLYNFRVSKTELETFKRNAKNAGLTTATRFVVCDLKFTSNEIIRLRPGSVELERPWHQTQCQPAPVSTPQFFHGGVAAVPSA
jgi:hypothetical protein